MLRTERAWPASTAPERTCGQQFAYLGQFVAQVIVDLDEVLPDGGAASGRLRSVLCGRCRPRRLVPQAADGRTAAPVRRGGAVKRARLRRTRLFHHLAYGRSDLVAVAVQGGRIVAHHDETADAVVQRQLGELLRDDLAADVQQPPDARGSRPAPTAAESMISFISASSAGPRLRYGRLGSQPSAFAADQAQHARLVRAEPDRRRRAPAPDPAWRRPRGSACRASADAAALVGVPDAADDVDGLVQRVDGLAGRQPPPAHRLDRVPERRPRRCPARSGRRDSRSRLATLRARTAGWRSGRLSTLPGKPDAARSTRPRRTAASRCRGTPAGTGGPGTSPGPGRPARRSCASATASCGLLRGAA